MIGASGQVGGAILEAARAAGHEAAGTAREHPAEGLRPLDLLDPVGLRSLLSEVRPEWVFCPAGMANVDLCEDRFPLARRVNVEGTTEAALASFRAGARWFGAFSSEYVFDGAAGPYSEDDTPNPLGAYGFTKLEMETRLLALEKRILIVRTTVVYGPERQRKNFVYQLLRAGREEGTMRGAVDQRSSPTYNPDLAAALLELAQAGAAGVLHIAGPEVVSRYDFAREVLGVFGLPAATIQPVSTADLGQRAKRPLAAGLKIGKALGLLHRARLRTPREGLEAMRDALRGAPA